MESALAIDSGDTAWVLASAALVLVMTPGLGFFYGGLVKGKHVLNTLMMSVLAMGVVAVVWTLLGYSLAFATGTPWIGGLEFLGARGVGAAPRTGTTIPHNVFMVFQMMFALITPALISGAIVGRMKFSAYVAFIALWSLLVYSPLAHWVWGGGWIGAMGTLDFAGGTVVHVSAGVSALVAAIILGPRREHRVEPHKPHNVPLVVLGAALLWFGWCGFNSGSALAANGVAGLALVNTTLGAAMAMVVWAALEARRGKKATAVGAATGAVVGLVAITPGAGFVTPMGALAIGALTALASFTAIHLMARSRHDDSLDVFACHGVGGAVGSLLTGVFATAAVNPAGANGLLHGNPGLMFKQLIGVSGAAAMAALATAAILLLIKATFGLRASAEAEDAGLDYSEHGEGAYGVELFTGHAPSVSPRAEELTPRATIPSREATSMDA